MRGGAVRKLVALIRRRSRVQIPFPLPNLPDSRSHSSIRRVPGLHPGGCRCKSMLGLPLPDHRKCRTCKVDKPPSEFSLRAYGRRNSKCKECVRQYSKGHYLANSEAHNARRLKNQRIHRRKNQVIMRAAKDKPCADCEQEYPYYVMQFDHLGDKLFTIGEMVAPTRREKPRCYSESRRCAGNQASAQNEIHEHGDRQCLWRPPFNDQPNSPR